MKKLVYIGIIVIMGFGLFQAVYAITTLVMVQDEYEYLETVTNSSIARDSNGYFYAVYNHYNISGVWGDIIISRSTDDGKTWTNYTLFTSSTRAQYSPKVAVDNSDNIFVVWETTSPTVNDGVKNISLIKGTWGSWGAREDVTDSADAQFVPSLAVDSANNVHITWYGKGYGVNTTQQQIVYRKRNADNSYGSITALTDKNLPQYNPSIAIDSLNNIHLAWFGGGWGTHTTTYQIVYETYDGAWETPENTDFDNATELDALYCDIAVDSNNIPHIVFSASYNYVSVRYMNRIGGTWSVPIIIGGGDESYQAYYASISISSSDDIAVAFEAAYGTDPFRNIVLRKKIGGVWQDRKQITFYTSNYQTMPNLLWARWGGGGKNIPKYQNAYLIWWQTTNGYSYGRIFFYGEEIDKAVVNFLQGKTIINNGTLIIP